MNLYYDSVKSTEIKNRILEKFQEGNQNRTKIHLSDYCYCPMKVFNRLTGMEKMDMDDTANILMVGNVGQELIQILYPDHEAEVEDNSILPSHVDILEDMNIPLEIKWTTTKIQRSSDIKEEWISQLMGYMAIHDSPDGWLLIMNLGTRQFGAWKMSMEMDELAELRTDMEMFRDNMYRCVEIWLSGEKDEAINLIELPLTEKQVKDCGWCDYRPGRKRARLGLEGFGCVRYMNNKSLETLLRQTRL